MRETTKFVELSRLLTLAYVRQFPSSAPTAGNFIRQNRGILITQPHQYLPKRPKLQFPHPRTRKAGPILAYRSRRFAERGPLKKRSLKRLMPGSMAAGTGLSRPLAASVADVEEGRDARENARCNPRLRCATLSYGGPDKMGLCRFGMYPNVRQRVHSGCSG